jgi:alginate production protein
VLTPRLHYGLEVELTYERSSNLDLDSNIPDGRGEFETEASIALAYRPTDELVMFMNLEPSQVFTHGESDGEERTFLELKELNLTWQRVGSKSKVEAGRMDFDDERQWLFDEGLDGVRLSYAFPNFEVQLSASRKNTIELLHGGENDRADYYELRGNHIPGEDALISVYAIARKDREEGLENPVFYGLHGEGPITDRLEYWLELARAAGRSAEGRISASAVDFGLTYEIGDASYRPSLVLGYAYGSGDDNPLDDRDGNFRQTGLQDNEAKLTGVAGIDYYGVLFQPELSNLHIVTAGLGIRPAKKLSLELLYHSYRQDKVSATIRDSELEKDPGGLSGEIGREFDIVGGYKNKQVKAELAIGHFRPGAAFSGKADDALFMELQIQYNF